MLGWRRGSSILSAFFVVFYHYPRHFGHFLFACTEDGVVGTCTSFLAGIGQDVVVFTSIRAILVVLLFLH